MRSCYNEISFHPSSPYMLNFSNTICLSKLTPLAKLLDNVGNIMDAIGFINAIETLVNWNSDSNTATEVAVYVKTKNIAYMYLSVVGSNLIFKEMFSGYTGQVIKTVDPIYQINMK